MSEQFYVAGKRAAFRSWASGIERWTTATQGAQQLTHIEGIGVVSAKEKLRGFPPDPHKRGFLEVVLHNAGQPTIVDSFLQYAQKHQSRPLADKIRNVRGLTFVPIEVDFDRAEELALFSFVRVARPIPELRPLLPDLARSAESITCTLPTEGSMDPSFRALIFDGGLTEQAVSVLKPWVNHIEPTPIGPPIPGLQEHGLSVTSALLFGPIDASGVLPRPICSVDHVRVVDQQSTAKAALDYVDVLDRIINYLDANPGKYQFLNISLGPHIPVSDDEVNQWTARLDDRLAFGRAVATVAAGNDGHLGADENRIQPPSDGVNLLSVGAADQTGATWKRANYSCVGPGRTPGFVKPDGVAFGGCDTRRFGALSLGSVLSAKGTAGTSFASPFVLRSATSVRAQLGPDLSPLAIRGLLIHRADAGSHKRNEVGWGKFEHDMNRLITCEDNEALVIYQGNLPVGEHLRALIPLPSGSLSGFLFITSTLVIAPEIDPEHPGAYTRSGLEVIFRPNATRYREYKDGTRSKHPSTRSFFTASKLYGAAEYVVRDEHYKWEPCLRATQKFRANALNKPMFDIYYHHRQSASANSQPAPIPYALIVQVRAPKVPDFYNRVVRTYANVLVPLQPRISIRIQR